MADEPRDLHLVGAGGADGSGAELRTAPLPTPLQQYVDEAVAIAVNSLRDELLAQIDALNDRLTTAHSRALAALTALHSTPHPTKRRDTPE